MIHTLLSQQLTGVKEAIHSMRRQSTVSPQDTAHNPERSATMRVLTNAMSAVRTVQMIDPQGIVASTNRTDTLGFDASHRDYFLNAKKAPSAGTLYVSVPVTTTLGVYAVNIVRAWTGDQNLLLGLTTAKLDPGYFKVLLRSVLHADDMRASLVHGDGSAFLTQPDSNVIQGADLKRSGTLFSQHVGSGQVESYFGSTVALTDDTRLVVYRTVSPKALHMNKPLLLAVSRGQGAVQEPRRQLALVLALGYTAVCGLTLGAIYFFRRRRKVSYQMTQTRASEAQEQAQRLDLALAGGNLGLFDRDMVTGILRVNARAQEIVGDGSQDPVEPFATWFQRIHPGDQPGAHAGLHHRRDGAASRRRLL